MDHQIARLSNLQNEFMTRLVDHIKIYVSIQHIPLTEHSHCSNKGILFQVTNIAVFMLFRFDAVEMVSITRSEQINLEEGLKYISTIILTD